MKRSLSRWLLLLATILFLGVFLVYPMLHVLVRAVVVDGTPTLTFVVALFANAGLRQGMLNSIMIGVYATLLSMLIALPLAWIFARYRFPGRTVLNGLMLVPMVMPPFVGALGLKQVFARCGSLNLLLEQLGLPTVDWFGGGGMLGVVVLEVLHLYPIMYLNVAAALANVDPAMEEAAANLGARAWTIFRRITFPLMSPGLCAGAIIVFIWAFTDPGAPLMFEYRTCMPVQMFDTLSDLNENPIGYAIVVYALLISLLAFWASKWFAQRTHVVPSGKGATADYGRRPSRCGLLGIYALLLGITAIALLPHLTVLGVALSDTWFMTIFPRALTDRYFKLALTHRLAASSIRISLILSGLATMVDILFGVTLGYLFVRSKSRVTAWLDTLVMLPLAIPGIVLAFGYVASFQSFAALDPRRDAFPLLIICYSVRRLPYLVRSAYAGFQQLSETFEEAAYNLGARATTVLRKITIPLMSAHILAGAILAFSFAVFEVGSTLVLAFREDQYPIAKAIYLLSMRLTDGPNIASAMGILGMLLLGASLLIAGTILGQRMGELFRSR
jgi:iron(III) transport system permease protein